MEFYENFLALCAKNGLSPSGAASKIGLSNAAASGWKKGKRPNDLTLNKLAALFNVSVDELTRGGPCSEKPSEFDLTNTEKQLIRDFRSLDDARKEWILHAMSLAVSESAAKNKAVSDMETVQ